MIVEVFPTGPIETNAILIGCDASKKALVIDPGHGCKKKILKKAQNLGLLIEKIYLTHSHWDHTADLASLKKELNCPVYVHPLDADNVKKPGADGLPLFVTIEPVEPDEYLEEGQVHTLGELSFIVIHTPGHSPGGVCFYFEKEKLLISGDTLFKGSFGKVSFDGSDPEKMFESLKKLADLPKDTVVIPGHGPKTSIGGEPWLKEAKEYFGF